MMPQMKKIILGLGLLAVVQAAPAALITLDADHFSVTYDSEQAALYGAGAVSGSGDTLYFQPSSFSALSGGGSVSVSAPLQLTFTIDPGYVFSGLSFSERGDYFLIGDGSVNVAIDILATNADTAAFATLGLAPGSPLNQTGRSTSWALSGDIAAAGLDDPQTLQVDLDNALFASASAGGLGFIQKTYVGFRVFTVAEPSPVPEPSSLALLLAGILAALMAGRRQIGMRFGLRPKRTV